MTGCSGQGMEKVLQLVLVPRPCLWSCCGPAPSGHVLGAAELGGEAAAGHCQPCSDFTFCWHGVAGQGQGQCLGSCSHPQLARGHGSSPDTAPPPEQPRGRGREDLTRLQMEQSGLGEELAAHPDGDKSKRCQSHLQWKTTKWLVGRQLVDEGAGNCSSLLSHHPALKRAHAQPCSPLLCQGAQSAPRQGFSTACFWLFLPT